MQLRLLASHCQATGLGLSHHTSMESWWNLSSGAPTVISDRGGQLALPWLHNGPQNNCVVSSNLTLYPMPVAFIFVPWKQFSIPHHKKEAGTVF